MSDVIEKTSVSTALAHRIIDAAERKAAEIGVPMVIAVCDESGVLKAFSRMDGAALLSVQIAQDKAFTAAGFGMGTDAWHDFIKDDPPLAASIERFRADEREHRDTAIAACWFRGKRAGPIPMPRRLPPLLLRR